MEGRAAQAKSSQLLLIACWMRLVEGIVGRRAGMVSDLPSGDRPASTGCLELATWPRADGQVVPFIAFSQAHPCMSL